MVTRRHVDHILNRSDVPAKDDDDVPESRLSVGQDEQDLVSPSAEKEQKHGQ